MIQHLGQFLERAGDVSALLFAKEQKHLKQETQADTSLLLVDAKEAARMCSVGKSTWLRYTSSGKTPKPITLGGRTLWRLQELLAWIDAGCPARTKWENMRRIGT